MKPYLPLGSDHGHSSAASERSDLLVKRQVGLLEQRPRYSEAGHVAIMRQIARILPHVPSRPVTGTPWPRTREVACRLLARPGWSNAQDAVDSCCQERL